jgi:hypothetical protein
MTRFLHRLSPTCDVTRRRTASFATRLLVALGVGALFVGNLHAQGEAPAAEQLALTGAGGLILWQNFSAAPDKAGVVKTLELLPGDFDVACYWAPFQKYDISGGIWYNAANRLQPLAVNRVDEMKEGGLTVLFQLKAGGYLAVLPLTGAKTIGWLEGKGGKLLLHVGNLGTARVVGDVPAVAWCRSDDPYAALSGVWKRAIECEPIRGQIKWRQDKPLPHFVNYLGFCTWEEYRTNYDAKKLVSMIRDLNAADVPVRWIQIGAGHHDLKPLGKLGSGQKLNSFNPSPTKFPEGWQPVMDALKPDRVAWLGVFQALNGSFGNGIHPENELGDLNRYLRPVPGNQLQPQNSPEAAGAFYDAMLGTVGRNGFKFVKMDFQTLNTAIYLGTEDPVGSAVNNERAYQRAVEKYLEGTINCMAHNPVCVFNTGNSNITRVSEDYAKGNLRHAIRQINNCYGNLPIIGQTCWGDFDMFHSSDQVSGKIMAVAKALSGGTVYLSDKISEIAADRVKPICYQDGQTLRPEAPPAPLPETFFLDPFKSGKAFRAIVPLAQGAAAVVAYNLTEPQKEVAGTVSPADYLRRSAMLQPYPGATPMPREGLVLYDWRKGQAERFTSEKKFTLRNFNEDRFFLLCPVTDGWSIIGRSDKYLSPSAVELVSRTPREIVVKMVESGPLAIWSEKGEPKAEGYRSEFANGLLKIDVPPGKAAVVVRITR